MCPSSSHLNTRHPQINTALLLLCNQGAAGISNQLSDFNIPGGACAWCSVSKLYGSWHHHGFTI